MAINILDDLPTSWLKKGDGFYFGVKKLDPGSFTGDPATYLQTTVMSTLLTFSSDLANCGASEVTLCLEADCTTLASEATDKTSLLVNPTISGDDGNIGPQIRVDKRTAFETTFFLVAKNSGPTVVSASIPILVAICGVETLVLAEDGPKVYLFKKNTGSKDILSEEELLGLFTLGGSDNCPITTIELQHQSNSTAILATDELGILLSLGTRATSFDALSFNTAFTAVSTEVEKAYLFKVKATTAGTVTVTKEI